jgi:hypothetical protein
MYTGMSQGYGMGSIYSTNPSYSLDTSLGIYTPSQDRYSSLEQFVLTDRRSSALEHILEESPYFSSSFSKYFTNSQYLSQHVEHHEEQVASFLKPCSETFEHVTDAFQIQEYASDIFRKLTGHVLPSDIEINVLPEKTFEEVHASHRGESSSSVLGFSLNRVKQKGLNQVFVKEGSMELVLVVLGHEIGHVLSKPLRNIQDEEAKAFAFEYAWVETIMQYNFGGVSNALQVPIPAQNGLHDAASSFVLEIMKTGKRAMQIFKNLIHGELHL